MTKLTRIVILATVLVTSLSTITPNLNVEASTTLPIEEVSQDNITLSSEEIINFDKYINLNDDSSYGIKDEALKELTSSEYEKLDLVLSIANQKIKDLATDPEIIQNYEVDVLPPQNGLNQNQLEQNPLNQNQLFAAKSKYKEGISKVTVHWWGLHIKISKTHVNKGLAAGITLGGIWMPSKVLATIGVSLGVTGINPYPGGIWVDQYWVAAIGPVKTLFGFNAVGFQ